MTILTAVVAPVHMGQIVIEGIMSETGRYYISVPQFCELFGIDTRQASRTLKGLLGKDSGFDKVKIAGDQNHNYSNAVSLDEFKRLMFRLALKGNNKAIDLSEDLINLSLTELFNDAFGIGNTPESRQRCLFEWHSAISTSKLVHSGFSQACKKKKHPDNQVHDYMTILIFGDTAEAARMKALVDSDDDPMIGLNHQSDIEGMRKLAEAKVKYTNKKTGDWRSQVEWAVAQVLK